eukprot:g2359.t1
MLIVFAIDTSASMNQRGANGLSLLEHAKAAAEHFMRARQRLAGADSRADRYLLTTCHSTEPVRVGWADDTPCFVRELKALEATDSGHFGAALSAAFGAMSQFRMQSGIDCFGQGRYPMWAEHTRHGGVRGSELVSGPLRWDQRMFAIVLRVPGTQAGTGGVRLEGKSQSAAELALSSALPTEARASAAELARLAACSGGLCFVVAPAPSSCDGVSASLPLPDGVAASDGESEGLATAAASGADAAVGGDNEGGVDDEPTEARACICAIRKSGGGCSGGGAGGSGGGEVPAVGDSLKPVCRAMDAVLRCVGEQRAGVIVRLRCDSLASCSAPQFASGASAAPPAAVRLLCVPRPRSPHLRADSGVDSGGTAAEAQRAA